MIVEGKRHLERRRRIRFDGVRWLKMAAHYGLLDLRIRSSLSRDVMELGKVGVALETGKSLKKAMNEKRNIEFCLDSGKPNNYSDASMASDSSNTSVNNVLNHQQLSAISKAQQKSLTRQMVVANIAESIGLSQELFRAIYMTRG
ncbi:hypothetical protein Tco_0756819 [Tanacetum coccineum]